MSKSTYRTPRPEPKCRSLRKFLTSNLGKRCLAPLTGTDSRALDAAVHIMEHYSYDRHPSLLEAFKLVVLRMQPSTRWFAYHAIAHCMDWSDRFPIWEDAGLGDIYAPMCAFEPGGTYTTPK